MYNFVYLFFFNIISFIVQANYIGIKLLYIGMNIRCNHKKDFHFTRDLKNIFNNSHDVNLHWSTML